MKDDFKIKQEEEDKKQRREKKKEQKKERKRLEDAAALLESQAADYDNRAQFGFQTYMDQNIQPQPADLEPIAYIAPKMQGAKDGNMQFNKMKAAVNNEHNQQIIAEDDPYYMPGAKGG